MFGKKYLPLGSVRDRIKVAREKEQAWVRGCTERLFPPKIGY